MGTHSSLRINLFKNTVDSFLAELDSAGIHHSRIQQFSMQPQGSSFIEAITAVSDAMPWNAIAKIIVKWLDVKATREVIITSESNEVFHTKGFSAKEVEQLLTKSVNLMVIDRQPEDKK